MRRTAILLVLAAALLVPGMARAGFHSPWATVSCADTPGLLAAKAAGVYHDDGTVDLRLPVCAGIGQMQDGQSMTDPRFEALFTLAHELSHAAGYGHDDTPEDTDCHAHKIVVSVARKLAIPAATVKRIAEFNQGLGWYCWPNHVAPKGGQ